MSNQKQRQNIINNQIRIVYKMQYAIKMQLLGHTLLNKIPNPTNENYDCWIFELDNTFDSDLHELIEEGRRSRYV